MKMSSTCVSCLAQSCSLVAQDWNSQSCPVSEGFPLDPSTDSSQSVFCSASVRRGLRRWQGIQNGFNNVLFLILSGTQAIQADEQVIEEEP